MVVLCVAHTAKSQAWTKKTDFINGESANAYCFSINDTIYVGNTAGLGFYKYDHTTDTWTPKGDVPTALFNRTASTSFVINGKGYLMGGIGPDGVCRSDVWEYTPGADTWVQKNDFAGGKRTAAGAFVIADKAYVGGGNDTIDILGFSLTPKNDFWQYDPVADNWVSRAALPYPSSYLIAPFAFSINYKGYFACGDRARLVAGVYHDTDVNMMYEYDTLADAWTKKADFPGLSRSGGVSFVLNNKAYCGTGIKDSAIITSYDDFYAYDPVTDNWASVSMPPFGSRTYALAATVSTNKAYVGTGWQAPSVGTYFKDWWEFRPMVTEVSNNKAFVKLNCYPNPCIGSLNVDMPGVDITRYAIYGITGKRISEGKMPGNGTIPTLSLSSGAYLLEINGNGEVYRQVFTVSQK